MKRANIFGPFIGKLEWEMFYFAPHMIHLAKKTKFKSIVFTRKSRFDLYGMYADILVPLDINESDLVVHGCGIEGYEDNYEILAELVHKKYKRKFKIMNHLYPAIHDFYRTIKWQFPRSEMDYSFIPRLENKVLVDNLGELSPKNIFIDLTSFRTNEVKEVILSQVNKLVGKKDISITLYDPNFSNGLRCSFPQIKWINSLSVDNKYVTDIGCIMSILNKSLLTVGNLDSPYSHLSLLKKVPLVSILEDRASEDIELMNPLKTEVFVVKDIHTQDITEYITSNLMGEK